MGGKAFGRQAKRMTTRQLELLKHHCVAALQDIFVGIMPLRHYTKKEIHGDLDLICAWPGIKLGHFTSHGGRGSVDVSVHDITWEWDHVSCESPLREFDGWCGAVAYKVGAVHWTRFNYETPVLSLKVLCELLEKDTHNTDGYDKAGIVEEEDDGAKPFYQVDLLLVPPESLQFAHFLASGGSLITLLFAGLRALSPSLTLQTTFLSVCHSPYPNSKCIRVILTSSMEELCNWLGLNLQTWQAGISDEQAFRRWIANPVGDGILWEAWRRVVSGYPTTPGQGKRRKETWESFKSWLDDIVLLQEYYQGRQCRPNEEISSPVSLTRIGSQFSKKQATQGPQARADTTHTMKPGVTGMNYPDAYALEALDRWGKQNEFEISMEVAKRAADTSEEARKQRARIKAEARRRRTIPIFLRQEGARIVVRVPGQDEAITVEGTSILDSSRVPL